MLVQYCSKYGQDVLPEELDEKFDLTLSCMEDDLIAIKRDERHFLDEPLQGVWEFVGFRNDEHVGVLTRVRAQLPTSVKGLKNSTGIGDHGRGRSIDTYAIEASPALCEELAPYIRSMYEPEGGSYERVCVDSILQKAQKKYNPATKECLLLRAIEFEAAKGPLTNKDVLNALYEQYGTAVKYTDSFRGFMQGYVTGIGPLYIALFRNFKNAVNNTKV